MLDIFNQRVLKFLTGLHVTSQPPPHIATGATFGMSVDLRDIGSGIVFTDFTGRVRVRITLTCSSPGYAPADTIPLAIGA